MNKKIALFGEYLLRLTPPYQQKIIQANALEMHWAGSEANIAVSLSILGDSPLYISAMPENELARAGLAQLYKYGVQTHILTKSDTRVGTYYYESGQGSRAGRIIYDREHSAFSHLAPGQINWNELFKTNDWFHWSGITPALNQQLADTCKEALQAAQKSNLLISADFNYRSTLWKYGKHPNEIMPELLEYCNVLLADIDTAKLYLGITPDEQQPVESTFYLLKKVLPRVKYIAMTMRRQDSASSNQYTGHLWHEGEIFNSQPYQLQNIAERIGAGDAFMAGLIHSLRANSKLEDAINFATACGVIKHSITGDFNIASMAEIQTVIQQKGSGRIIR